MRAFLEEYGIAIFLVAIIVALVILATPLGNLLGQKLRDLMNTLTQKFQNEVNNGPGI